MNSMTKLSGARTWRRLGSGSIARFVVILVAGIASPLLLATDAVRDDAACAGYIGASGVRALLAVAGVASILLALPVMLAGRDETLDNQHRSAGPMALVATALGWVGTWLFSLIFFDAWDTQRGPEPALTISNAAFLPIAGLSLMLIAAAIAGRISRTLPRVAVFATTGLVVAVIVPVVASGFVGSC